MSDHLAAISARIDVIRGQHAAMRAPLSARGSGVVLGAEVASPDGTGPALTFGDAGPRPRPTGKAFDTVFAEAATTGPTHVHGHDERLVGGVPASLAAYGNGRIPADALAGIGVDGHRLWAPAAAAFTDLLAAAAADGITIGVTDSYRPYDVQVRLAEEKGLYSEGGLAARPGTSEHGWGKAVDLRLDAAAQAWMRANGPRFGFVENVPREPWHWEYLTAEER